MSASARIITLSSVVPWRIFTRNCTNFTNGTKWEKKFPFFLNALRSITFVGNDESCTECDGAFPSKGLHFCRLSMIEKHIEFSLNFCYSRRKRKLSQYRDNLILAYRVSLWNLEEGFIILHHLTCIIINRLFESYRNVTLIKALFST